MYHRPRIIPLLLISNRDLVKTIKFANPRYIGDPINSVKIFNGKGVDELCVLNITASKENRTPDFEYLKDIAGEAFMPLSYGGGITDIEQIKKIFHMGYEKVVINTAFYSKPKLINEAARYAGSQSVVVSIDVKTDIFGKKRCFSTDGTIKTKLLPIEAALLAETLGAGELIVNSVNNDGAMCGYDIELIRSIAEAVSIPVTACGGAKDITDLKKVLTEGKAHAAAAGSMFVYYGRENAVLITVPSENDLIDSGFYRREGSQQ
ncbi:MAG: AglZ/HisF2 family acetamidino modification protein [Eubacteriales bacterium]|nr:AglZ/HisF2 family acetamidino modification protein [Eubacteriales bacterium]MDD4474329.1 AglZ/HisF2 family acetamidino modification protein [Eubacteriales bacterium]